MTERAIPLLLWLAALAVSAPVDLHARVQTIVPGQDLTFAAADGDVEIAFPVGEDQYVHLEVLQLGTDVAVTVLDPAGAVLRNADDAGLERALETVSWTRSSAGTYTARLHVKERVAQGRFHARLDPLRPSEETDEVRLRAERALTAAEAVDAGLAEARSVNRARLEEARADGLVLRDERLVARARMYLGMYFMDEGEPALALCLDAAEYAARSDDRSLDDAFVCVAAWLGQLGYLSDAIAFNRELLERRRRMGVPFLEIESMLNLSSDLINSGYSSEARGLLEEALENARGSSDTTAEAFALAYLARLHRDRGEYQEALDLYTQSLAISHPHHRNRALHLAELASVQLALGDLAVAHATVRRAVAASRRAGMASIESQALGVLGQVLLEQGRSTDALAQLSENVALTRRKKLVQVIDALIALGRAEARVGRTSSAGRHYREALAHSRSSSSRAGEVHAQLALCALEDQTAGAVGVDACSLALELANDRGFGQASLLSQYYLARAFRRRGDGHAAHGLLEQALSVVESRRLDLRRADLRRTFSASVDDIETEYVDLLVALAEAEPAGGWEERAFEASERARGRSLRDELAASRADIREGVDPRLLEDDRALRDRLRATLSRQLLDTPVSADVRRGLERDVSELNARLAELEGEIRRSSPRYATLSQPQVTSLASVREALVDDATVLLFYALGQRRSFLWVVSPDALERHVLPGRAHLERLVGRAISDTARSRGPSAAAMSALARAVLVPARARLSARRVLVVPDGALHYVPFAALPDPLGRGPLLGRVTVAHLPSASTGVMLARAVQPHWTHDVAIFADPVFRRDDERLAGTGRRVADAGRLRSLPRELLGRGRAGLSRLPFTRQEARSIHRLAQDATLALDFDASLPEALAPSLSSYRFVHFATHGLLNASRPELSGIVLSLYDEKGRPRDGFLTSLDTFSLRLDAELVVLSGCRTALGRSLRSEGIVGLTRGFMYAGARGVLASLWPVDDAATAALMRVFYEGLLGPRKLAPPAALREAQLRVRSDPRWTAPYYWAAFQLQGVWKGDERPGAAAPYPGN